MRHHGIRRLSLLVVLWAVVLPGCGESPPARPNIVLISIDTLRADRLGAYDPERGLTPHLDALARESAVFDRAISQAPWTTPSHMSLFTSLHPSSHGVNQGWRDFMAFTRGETGYRILPNDVPMLAEVLRDAGYRTRALTGGGTVGAALGFDRGFEVFRDDARKLRPEHWTQLADWLDEDDDRPLFLFLHTFEVHAPYLHTEEALGLLDDEQIRRLERFIRENPEATEKDHKMFLIEEGLHTVEISSALYDGGVRFTDAFLGDLFDALRERGLWDETIIVFVSDHGEEFADHRPEKFYNVHCDALWNEFVQVPFLLRVPGRYDDGRRVHGLVRLVDVAPTLLDILELPANRLHQGTSLTPRLDGDTSHGRGAVFSEAPCIGDELKSLRTDRYTYIVRFELPRGADRTGIPGPPLEEMLYDTSVDPREQVDLSEADPELRSRMRRRLARFFTEETKPVSGDEASAAMDPELEEQLRALGYID